MARARAASPAVAADKLVIDEEQLRLMAAEAISIELGSFQERVVKHILRSLKK